MRSINPATGELGREYPEHSDAQIRQKLQASAAAFDQWRRTSFAERARLMRKAAEALRAHAPDFGQQITLEMGKPIAAAEAEVSKCATVCDFYAENAERFLATEVVASDAHRSYVRYDPLGPVLAIMPWNFPFWQVFRFAAPALMAGNVGLLKHASNVPGTALAIERIFVEAGFPEGCFTTLLVGSPKTASLIADDIVRAVTLTGSDKAGEAVAAAAGRQLKKTVLELGGSDAFIVLADADLAKVAKSAADARCVNSGQSCIAAKRFIVEERVADEFTARFVEAMKALVVGDPLDRKTQVGPLAREDIATSLEDQVRRSLDAGAKLLCGGHRRPGRGYYYEPTVLSEVRPGMAAFDEETFGPVAAVIRARDPDDAIALSNASPFALGASIWTRDLRRAEQMAGELEAGAVFINGIVKSDPRLPFGGNKRSGYGRELSAVGIREFTNVKTVWVGE